MPLLEALALVIGVEVVGFTAAITTTSDDHNDSDILCPEIIMGHESVTPIASNICHPTKLGIPDFVTSSPKKQSRADFVIDFASLMARSKRNRVNAILGYLWKAELAAVDPWEQEDYRLAANALREAFENNSANPWEVAFKKKYGKDWREAVALWQEQHSGLLRDRRPLAPSSPYKQLALPFGPFVVGNLNQDKQVKKLPKKALVMRKAAGQ